MQLTREKKTNIAPRFSQQSLVAGVGKWIHAKGDLAKCIDQALLPLPKRGIFLFPMSEDKFEVARPLANILSTKGMKVWLDESELFVGDSLRAKIDEGLARSQFGIVILSPSFFSKHWAQAELDGLRSARSSWRQAHSACLAQPELRRSL